MSKRKQKTKTSVNIDKEIWQKWILFVVTKTGSSRRLSEELERALMEYMDKYGKA